MFFYLNRSADHPTAEAVHAAITEDLPNVSLRTVYQTLNDLASMGELVPVNVGRDSTRFDTNVSPHHHVMCGGCGEVVDIALDFTPLHIPDGLPEGFSVSHTEVVLHGTCGECSDPSGAPASRTTTHG